MKILILGAGLIGTTLAYVLTARGYEVVVLDRQDSNAQECSFSNGGQLSYSHAEPWACPTVLPKIIQWLGRKEAPLVFRMRIDPAMWRWALQFLRHCTPAKAREGTRAMLRLAQESQHYMEEILHRTGISFDYQPTGIMRLFASERTWQQGIRAAMFQEKFGFPFEVLTKAEALAKEPALVEASFTGAVYYPDDATGDAYRFSTQLEQHCLATGRAMFHYHTAITGLEAEDGKISRVITNQGDFTADAFVVALGADSPRLLRSLGIYVPIYPLKGYSVSIPIDNPAKAPQISITDMERKLVYSRLGGTLRVAGTAELTGYDTSHTRHRIAPLLRHAQTWFPGVGKFAEATHWACLRPSTPDGTPLIGPTVYPNLYLNTGHGSLGWTLAMGSAYRLADSLHNNLR